jgi:hypothetical protein
MNEKDKRCWIGLFKCGMHALNVSCVMHPLWEFVMLRWTFVMHELYVPSDKSMCMFCMVVGCCLPWRKFMKDKKTLYTIFIAISIFDYTLTYKGLLVACLAMKEDSIMYNWRCDTSSIFDHNTYFATYIIRESGFITQKITTHDTCVK